MKNNTVLALASFLGAAYFASASYRSFKVSRFAGHAFDDAPENTTQSSLTLLNEIKLKESAHGRDLAAASMATAVLGVLLYRSPSEKAW